MKECQRLHKYVCLFVSVCAGLQSRIWVNGSLKVQLNRLAHVVLVREERLCFFFFYNIQESNNSHVFYSEIESQDYLHFFHEMFMALLSVKHRSDQQPNL